jgi:hypothetical protein
MHECCCEWKKEKIRGKIKHKQQIQIQEIWEGKETKKIEIKKDQKCLRVHDVVLFSNLKNKQAKHVYKTFHAFFLL